MSATQTNQESLAQVVAATSLQTAQQLLPLVIEGLAAGSQAATPYGVLIAMAAKILPPLVESFGADNVQVQQLVAALVPQIKAGQVAIDAAAAARGVTDPTAPPAP